jgi:hypothetical protein
MSSICILLIRGTLSFSSLTPGSISGTACPIGNHHAELERAEAGPRARVLLQEGLDLLVDRMPAGPARRSIRAALDVARKELDPSQQAAHAPHVVVAVAANLVAVAVQEQGAALERLERLEAFLELGPRRRSSRLRHGSTPKNSPFSDAMANPVSMSENGETQLTGAGTLPS